MSSSEGATRPIATRHSPKGVRRREEILEAAAEMFAVGGYDSAALEDIAQRVGITRAGLLHHFPSKVRLLHAVLDAREVRTEIGPLPTDGAEYLVFFLATLRHHEANPREMAFFAMMSTESTNPAHPAHEYFRERYDNLIPALTATMAQVFDGKKLPSHITHEDLARTYTGIADGLRIQWLFEPHITLRSELAARYLELLQPYMFDDMRERFITLLRAWRESSA